MTTKHGFYIGFVVGFLGWLFFNGYIVFTPAPIMIRGLVTFAATVLFILSVGLGIANALRGKATFGTTEDGFVYGFTAAFDLSYIAYQVITGKLPIPYS